MFARVQFELADQNYRESFTIDASIENDRINHNWYCGFYNDCEGERYPFTLLQDGRLDFGWYAGLDPDVSRFWASNIRERNLQAGEYITLRGHENGAQCEYTYRVSQIIRL
jgi:hypothetical protein